MSSPRLLLKATTQQRVSARSSKMKSWAFNWGTSYDADDEEATTTTTTANRIYFGNGVKCLQQCHNDSLFAAYVSSFIAVR